MDWIDISVPLSEDLPTWPDVWPYQVEWAGRNLPGGIEAIVSSFRMCTHHGTHMDAPFHFDKSGISIDQVSPDLLVGPCRVYEYKGKDHIRRQDLEEMGIKSGGRVLIKTGNSKIVRSDRFHEDYIALENDAMEYLVEIGVQLLGFDYFSIGPYGERNDSSHYIFLSSGGVIIETIDLSEVEPGAYQIIALPIKLAGLDGAPARVLLGRDNNK